MEVEPGRADPDWIVEKSVLQTKCKREKIYNWRSPASGSLHAEGREFEPRLGYFFLIYLVVGEKSIVCFV